METKFLITKNSKQNTIIYAAFLIIAVIGILYGNEIKNNFTFLRLWDYKNILILFLGIPFLFLQSKANLPNFVEESIYNKQRFLKPFLIGTLFGILDVIIIKIIMHPEPYTELPPFLQPFPYSFFLYFSGAFEIEVFYRLIPLTLILLLGKWFASGKYFNIFLWTAIVLTSVREPIEQFPNGELWFVIYALLTGFLMNFLQAIYFKNAGFLASITLRLGHYLFWHILLGFYVQYFELQ
ncbi:MAG: hypothetical protein JST43_10635 [Bacteroidetes bacterium]|nr:hypothetical protein [Bacteroidota bacterium]MBS1540162.1 hypothetical protein [Bacteroidota bacterium]